MAGEFQINFFRVMSESDLIPVMRRKLDGDEQLLDHETLYRVPRGEQYDRYAILSKFPWNGDESIYASHEMRISKLPRLARVRLLDDALCEAFRGRGFTVIRRRFEFVVQDDESRIPCSIEGIELRRGVEFHLDSAFLGENRHYGYFITLKISRSFSVGLDDAALQSAAMNQRLYYGDVGSDVPVVLQRVSGTSADVIKGDGSVETVATASLRVPASAAIVQGYLATRGERNTAYKKLLDEEQLAAMRRTARGQKRRDAVRAQGDFVSTWLIKNSEYGRLRFYWPFSESTMSLLTTQQSIVATEVF